MPIAKLNAAKVEYLAVHCSASPPDMDIGVPEITRWHRARGFITIGYHFVIRRNGVLEKGRPIDEMGAHVEGYNHCSVGICLVGGVNKKGEPEDNFTPDQMHTLALLLDDLRHHQFPKARIQGHRDFPNVHKACPSFDVREWLKDTAPWLLKP